MFYIYFQILLVCSFSLTPQNLNEVPLVNDNVYTFENISHCISHDKNCLVSVENKLVYTHNVFRVASGFTHNSIVCKIDQEFTQNSTQSCVLGNVTTCGGDCTDFIIHLPDNFVSVLRVTLVHFKNSKSSFESTPTNQFQQLKVPFGSVMIQVNHSLPSTKGYIKMFIPKIGSSFKILPITETWFGYSIINGYTCSNSLDRSGFNCNLPSINTTLGEIFLGGNVSPQTIIQSLFSTSLTVFAIVLILPWCIYFISNMFHMFHVSNNHFDILFNSTLFAFSLAFNLMPLHSNYRDILRVASSFCINYFFICTLNSFSFMCCNIIIKTHQDLNKHPNMNKHIYCQRAIFSILNVMSILSCLLIHFINTPVNTATPYIYHPKLIVKFLIPIFMVPLIIFFILALFTALSLADLYYKKARTYRFTRNTLSPEVIQLLNVVLCLMLSSATISASLFFYILFSQSTWIHESIEFLLISTILFLVYVILTFYGISYDVIYTSPAENKDASDYHPCKIIFCPAEYTTNHSKYDQFSSDFDGFNLSQIEPVNNNRDLNSNQASTSVAPPLFTSSVVYYTPIFGQPPFDNEVSEIPIVKSQPQRDIVQQVPNNETLFTSHLDREEGCSNEHLHYIRLCDCGKLQRSKSLYEGSIVRPNYSYKVGKKYPRSPFKQICKNTSQAKSKKPVKINITDLD